MMCVLCENQADENSKLCGVCNNARMLSASCDRIFNRTGITISNIEKYSEENWIEYHLELDKEKK